MVALQTQTHNGTPSYPYSSLAYQHVLNCCSVTMGKSNRKIKSSGVLIGGGAHRRSHTGGDKKYDGAPKLELSLVIFVEHSH